jgi:DNA-binding Lrp family transcriptional regulator
MKEKIRLDETDFKILHELLEDSSQSLTRLSKKLNTAKSTIHSRIKKLERTEVIEKYSIKMNMELLNYPLIAFIMLNYEQHVTNYDQEEVAKKIAKIAMVEEVHLIAGEWDILIKVRAKGVEELGEFSIKKLKKIEGIGQSLTYVVLRKIKEENSKPYVIDERKKI